MLKNNNKNIAIIGIGESGKSAIRYFIFNKYNIFAWDDSILVRNTISKEFPEINIKKPDDIKWEKILLSIVSPGISLNNQILKYANKFKVPIYRDLEIFSQNVDSKKIIAVTGTNGKSTTVSLISNMIKHASKENVFVGGNISPPLMDALKFDNYDKFVIELSSYQLESAPSFNSYISVLLNIYEDHIDRYGNINNYKIIKKNIFNNLSSEQYAVIGIDDERSKSIYEEIKKFNNNIIPISVEKELSFGVSMFKMKIIDNYFDKRKININDNKSKEFINHNRQNILATYVVAKILNYTDETFFESLNSFKTLKHRAEVIYSSKNLIIVNDSKATNLSSAIHSIKSNKNVYLIMGGKTKHKNYKELASLKKNIKKVYLIGEASKLIYGQLKDIFECECCEIMSTALTKCFKDIKKSSIFSSILLAPSCSSFDQYKNFEHRGNDFSLLSKKLIKENYYE